MQVHVVSALAVAMVLTSACTGTATSTLAPSASGAPPAGLLRAAAGGDGDSWKDTRGTEYRLGLVNAPEYNECFGPEATRERKRLVARGFRAQAYTVDSYGRHVADVTLADGRDLNVLLAAEGFVNDRYLKQFRTENPALAARLDAAFRDARASRKGLWGACPAG